MSCWRRSKTLDDITFDEPSENGESDGLHRAPNSLSAPSVTWSPGDDRIGRRTLRVLGVRDDDADQPPALVVEGPARIGH